MSRHSGAGPGTAATRPEPPSKIHTGHSGIQVQGSPAPVGRRRAGTAFAELVAGWVAAECTVRGLVADQRTALFRERAGHLTSLVRAAHESAQQRRQRVLAHRDLAGRLATVLRLASPNHWNGWVPPATLPEPACLECPDRRCLGRTHPATPNDSEIRAALVDIAAEAWRRDQEPAAS